MKWSKLSKKDKNHLRSNKIYTKDDFERQVIFQKQQLKDFHDNKPHCVCWECISIARKLGLIGSD